MLNEDYKEMLQCLSDAGVDFLVVGAFAMAVHGRPRATGDMDLWVVPARDNARKVYAALARFGAPLDQVDETTFATPGVVFQIGVAPRRIDIVTAIDGVDFDDAQSDRCVIEMDGLTIPFIGKRDLIRNKRATGRPKDRLDADDLAAL